VNVPQSSAASPDPMHQRSSTLPSSARSTLADWVKGWAPRISHENTAAIAAIGLNALLGNRATSTLFHAPRTDIPDEQYIAEWTAILANRIEALRQG
jgi:hypothetical protein